MNDIRLFGLDSLHYALFLLLVFLICAFDISDGAAYIQYAFIPFFGVSVMKLSSIKPSKELFFLTLFVIWSLASLGWTISMDYSSERFRTVLLLFLLFISGSMVKYTGTKYQFDAVFVCMLLGSVYIVYLLRDELIGRSILSYMSDYSRFGEDVVNSNAIGKLCALSLLFCLYKVIADKNKWYLLPLIVFLTLVILTKSKSAFLASLLASLFLFYRLYSGKYSKKKTVFALVVIVLVFYGVISSGVLGDAFYRLTNMFSFFTSGDVSIDESTATRAEFAVKGLNTFLESPILGYGIGSSYRLLNGTYYHNNYVQLLVETGIIGFTLYYGFIFLVIKRLFRNRQDPVNCLFIAFILVVLFCDLTNTTYYHKINYLVFALAVSHLNGFYQHRNRLRVIKKTS